MLTLREVSGRALRSGHHSAGRGLRVRLLRELFRAGLALGHVHDSRLPRNLVRHREVAADLLDPHRGPGAPLEFLQQVLELPGFVHFLRNFLLQFLVELNVLLVGLREERLRPRHHARRFRFRFPVQLLVHQLRGLIQLRYLHLPLDVFDFSLYLIRILSALLDLAFHPLAVLNFDFFTIVRVGFGFRDTRQRRFRRAGRGTG